MTGSTFAKIDAVKPLEGEAAAAKLGIEFAWQMGYRDILLEGDSELMIKAIQNFPHCMEWRIHATVQEIVEFGRKMHSCKAIHVRRGANEIMHHFARWAAAEFSLISGISRNCEHFLDLPWLYAGTESP